MASLRFWLAYRSPMRHGGPFDAVLGNLLGPRESRRWACMWWLLRRYGRLTWDALVLSEDGRHKYLLSYRWLGRHWNLATYVEENALLAESRRLRAQGTVVGGERRPPEAAAA